VYAVALAALVAALEKVQALFKVAEKATETITDLQAENAVLFKKLSVLTDAFSTLNGGKKRGKRRGKHGGRPKGSKNKVKAVKKVARRKTIKAVKKVTKRKTIKAVKKIAKTVAKTPVAPKTEAAPATTAVAAAK
jgi:hypothetical protein